MFKFLISVMIFLIASLSIDQSTLTFFGVDNPSAFTVLGLRLLLSLAAFAVYCNALRIECQNTESSLPLIALGGAFALMIGVVTEIQMLSGVVYPDVVEVIVLSVTIYLSIFCAIVAVGVGAAYHKNPRTKMIDPEIREYYNTTGLGVKSSSAILSCVLVLPMLGNMYLAFFTDASSTLIVCVMASVFICLVIAASRCVHYSAYGAEESCMRAEALYIFEYSFSKKETKLFMVGAFVIAALYLAKYADDAIASGSYLLLCTFLIILMAKLHRLVLSQTVTAKP